jgi:hypothetical protein
MGPVLVLLPSPLLGPVAWSPVADRLRAAGHRVRVLALPAGPVVPADLLARWREDLDGEQRPVLVPHSNAGFYAPALAEETGAAATVYVDAALPGPGGTTQLAPADFLAFLRALADEDGLLPPWTRWWAPEDLDPLFPDPAWRRRVEDGEPRLTVSYFESTLPVPDGWMDRPCGYLAFGRTYATEAARARAHRWPVRVLPGEHLELLHHPDAVSAAVLDLLGS